LQLVVACVLGVCSAAIPATAFAAQTGVLSDCNAHAQLTQQYPVGQLQTALATMGADQKEYTDCYDVIQRALLADVGRLHSGTVASQRADGSSFPNTPLIALIGVAGFAAGALIFLAVRRRRD
jgi:hypothetical protein